VDRRGVIHHGDCIDVMAGMDPESVDAIVTDPPYGIGFMGKEWDSLSNDPVEASWNARGRNTTSTRNPDAATPGGRMTTSTGFAAPNPRCGICGRTINGRDTVKGFKVCHCEQPTYAPTPNRQAQRSQEWHTRWAEAAYRVAKPSAYLLAFGGTRTVHRMTVALEDAGWIIRDMLVWGYASGFPKSKASLKPAWEPIVMARKPGPLRMLAIDSCRIGVAEGQGGGAKGTSGFAAGYEHDGFVASEVGRWPANIVLTDPIFDGGIVGDSGTYSRFFLVPKAARSDREPVLGGLPVQDDDRDGSFGLDAARPHTRPDYQYQRKARANVHPTVKPVDLMRHLVRLVTPTGGTVLDPFLGSGTTALAAEMEGFEWIGIEREGEYVAIAEARLNGTQRGLGLVG
jgi:site-specific DNA-methyltransferase (adenine-specific)